MKPETNHRLGPQRLVVRKTLRVIGMVGLSIWLVSWVAARALIVSTDTAHADAIAVLAGSATYIERADWAASLFAAGRAPRIILTNDGLSSGWSAREQRNPLFVERAVEELKSQGVPLEKIEIVPGLVANTYEEVQRLREYASARGWRSILIVTSAYQSRRALWIAKRMMDGVAVGIDPVAPGVQTPTPSMWLIHKLGWRMVPLEYVKLVYYRLRYR
jgi:uncharacterized SAM-binding protein YcdF (DUF218 family)